MFLPSEAVAIFCSLTKSYLGGTIKIDDVQPDVSESITRRQQQQQPHRIMLTFLQAGSLYFLNIIGTHLYSVPTKQVICLVYGL